MRKIVACGYYGFGNAGDEMILAALLEILGGGAFDVTVLSASPKMTSEYFKIKACDRWNIFEIIKSVSGSDVLLAGGGGLFQDKTSSLSLYYYLFIILLGRLFGKKIIIWSAGIGPLKYLNIKILKLFLGLADKVFVRDTYSLEFATNKKNNPGFCSRREDRDERGRYFFDEKSEGDAGTSYELFKEEKVRHRSSNPASYCKFRDNVLLAEDTVFYWKRICNKPSKKELSLICLSNTRATGGLMKIVSKVIVHSTDVLGLKPVLVPFFKSQDIDVCREVSKKFGIGLIEWGGVDDLVELFTAKAGFCLAMRYHAAVCAYMAGIPFAGVCGNYNSGCKIHGFLENYGIMENRVDINRADINFKRLRGHVVCDTDFEPVKALLSSLQ